MEPRQLMNQMVAFNKAAFDSTFNIIALLQEQTERMITTSLEQAAMLPKEGKKAYAEWLKALRHGEEVFKKAVDDGFQNMEAFLAK